MAQWLRIYTTLDEYQSSILNTSDVTTASKPRESHVLFWPLYTTAVTCAPTQRHTHMYKI